MLRVLSVAGQARPLCSSATPTIFPGPNRPQGIPPSTSPPIIPTPHISTLVALLPQRNAPILRPAVESCSNRAGGWARPTGPTGGEGFHGTWSRLRVGPALPVSAEQDGAKISSS